MKTILKNIKDVIQGKANLGQTRSSKWPKIRANHLLKNPSCAVCSGLEKIEVHHIKSFHENPELELDPNNLITLCESKSFGIVCHLAFGHLGDYKLSNPQVKVDSKHWNKKLKEIRRPKLERTDLGLYASRDYKKDLFENKKIKPKRK